MDFEQISNAYVVAWDAALSFSYETQRLEKDRPGAL